MIESVTIVRHTLHKDNVLTEDGIALARASNAKRDDYDLVIVSKQPRTYATAQILAPDVERVELPEVYPSAELEQATRDLYKTVNTLAAEPYTTMMSDKMVDEFLEFGSIAARAIELKAQSRGARNVLVVNHAPSVGLIAAHLTVLLDLNLGDEVIDSMFAADLKECEGYRVTRTGIEPIRNAPPMEQPAA